MTYTYSFVAWPDEQWGFPPSVFRLFESLGVRVSDEFSEQEFERFRSELSHHGISLREIERTPYTVSEIIP